MGNGDLGNFQNSFFRPQKFYGPCRLQISWEMEMWENLEFFKIHGKWRSRRLPKSWEIGSYMALETFQLKKGNKSQNS